MNKIKKPNLFLTSKKGKKMKPLIWIIDEEFENQKDLHRYLREKFPDCEIKKSNYDYGQDLEEFGHKADGILIQVHPSLPEAVINRLTNCRGISVFGSGFDQIDVAAATAKGIKVANVTDYCKEDIADYVLAAMLFFNKHLLLVAKADNKAWGALAVPSPTRRLRGCTLHIIGLGRIGREVAQRALDNGLKVTAFDPYVPEEVMRELNVTKTSWETGLREADYVSIHYALTPQTLHALKYDDFCLMKPEAVVINAARGKVIDETALIRAVKEKRLAGAMLDVVTSEPPDYGAEVFHCENIFVTPHISFISVESYHELLMKAGENLVNFLCGQKCPSQINQV